MSTWNLVGAVVVSGLLGAGCSSSNDGSGTTGRAIALKTRLDIKDDLTQAHTNALGWSITLTEAYLSVGPLYYYSGEPVLSRRTAPQHRCPSALARLKDYLVKPAFAHPGHYIKGSAMGQMLKPTTVDLLAGPIDLAEGEGVTGDTNSARFTWQSPPKGDLAGRLEGHVVLTLGTAEKEDTTIRFIAKADEPEVHDGDDKAEVAGCAFGARPGDVGVELDGDGTVTLTLVPSVWFDQVDFSYVLPNATGAPEPNAEGFVDIAGTLSWQGFIRGVKKGTSYEFSYEKE